MAGNSSLSWALVDVLRQNVPKWETTHRKPILCNVHRTNLGRRSLEEAPLISAVAELRSGAKFPQEPRTVR